MNVGRVCTKGAVTVPVSAPLSEVAQLMYERHVGAVIVTATPSERPVAAGIITDRDIVRAQFERTADFSRLQAAEVMSRSPLELNEQDSIEDALRQMQTRGVRRAPVVSANGALVGLVSTDDLLAEVSEELVNLAQLVAQQARRESP